MILILAATPLETALLRKQLSRQQVSTCGSHQLFSGKLRGQNILLTHGGIGSTAMAMQLTRILSEHSPLVVLLVGCGGSYPNSGLQIGSLALAEREVYGDLGVATENGFIPLEQLKLPQDEKMAPVTQQSFILNPDLRAWAQEILPEAACGTFVTVHCCSGTPALSTELEQRTGGICENMEGAVAAQVCSEFAVPLLELRGISNPTGTRNPDQWDIVKGMEAAQLGILELLENWPSE